MEPGGLLGFFHLSNLVVINIENVAAPSLQLTVVNIKHGSETGDPSTLTVEYQRDIKYKTRWEYGSQWAL